MTRRVRARKRKINEDVRLGLYDIVDNCWLGDDYGPALYRLHEREMAMLASASARLSLGWPWNRIDIRIYNEPANHKRDNLPYKQPLAESLRQLESGERI